MFLTSCFFLVLIVDGSVEVFKANIRLLSWTFSGQISVTYVKAFRNWVLTDVYFTWVSIRSCLQKSRVISKIFDILENSLPFILFSFGFFNSRINLNFVQICMSNAIGKSVLSFKRLESLHLLSLGWISALKLKMSCRRVTTVAEKPYTFNQLFSVSKLYHVLSRGVLSWLPFWFLFIGSISIILVQLNHLSSLIRLEFLVSSTSCVIICTPPLFSLSHFNGFLIKLLILVLLYFLLLTEYPICVFQVIDKHFVVLGWVIGRGEGLIRQRELIWQLRNWLGKSLFIIIKADRLRDCLFLWGIQTFIAQMLLLFLLLDYSLF